MVNLTINNMKVSVQEGTTILRAARRIVVPSCTDNFILFIVKFTILSVYLL